MMAGEQITKLKWRRKGGKLPGGEDEMVGEKILFESVAPEYEGAYQCVAEDQEGGELVSREVQLIVECKFVLFTINNTKS